MVPEDEKNLNSKDQGIEKVIEGIKSSNNRIEEIRARIDADIKARKQQLENEAKAVEEAKKEPEQIDLLSTETAEEEAPEIEVPEVGVEKTEEVLAEEVPVLEVKDETPAEEKAEALADAEVKETEGSTAEKPLPSALMTAQFPAAPVHPAFRMPSQNRASTRLSSIRATRLPPTRMKSSKRKSADLRLQTTHGRIQS